MKTDQMQARTRHQRSIISSRPTLPSSLAFFPWTYVDEPLEIGALRLLPYRRGELPGNLEFARQSDIDVVLGAYANRPGQPVDTATLLELADWPAGMDANDRVAELFRMRDLIAFAALADRRFMTHFDYCNFDTYTLVIQRYEASAIHGFAFTTKRRDGGSTQFWSSDRFSFQRPLHVDHRHRLSLDRGLLLSLLDISTAKAHIIEAAIEFNWANTDSGSIPDHVELVMMKSAFEWLLQIDSGARSFVKALLREVGAPDKAYDGPMCQKWSGQWPQASRPLEAWARDFCKLRGVSAHGMERQGASTVWGARLHLLFGALLFPLLLKNILARDGHFTIDAFDRERLQLLDSYLMHDPFDFDWANEERSNHPWSQVDMTALVNARAHIFYPDH